MADLLTPKTWTSGEVPTASSMNSGIRDPINRLNGFGDLITGATAADSGTATYLKITRPSPTSQVLEAWVSGEAFPRLRIRPQGIGFGDGTTNPTNFLDSIDIGGGALELRATGNFGAQAMRIETGPIIFSEEPQTSTLSYVEFPSIFAPPAPPVGVVRLFAGESLGVLKLMVRFPTGTVKHLESE